MTKEKLMRALMISSSDNPNYTQLLSAFRTGRFLSVETQNKNSQEIFGNRFLEKMNDEITNEEYLITSISTTNQNQHDANLSLRYKQWKIYHES